MTQPETITMTEVTQEADHVLIKRGLYYRPNGNGYTGLKSEAGLYHASYAMGFDGVLAVPFADAPDFAPACWEETKIAYFEAALATARAEAEAKDAEIAALREAGNVLRDKLLGFVGAMALYADCGPDVDAIKAWEAI